MKRIGYCTSVIMYCSLVFWVGCSTSGPPGFDGKPVIKPLSEYQSSVARDVAHLLYPSFQEIQQEITVRYPDQSIRLMPYGLQVIRLDGKNLPESGLYIRMELFIAGRLNKSASFMQQAQQVGTNYIHPVLVALSSDWERVFSPGITGSIVIFHWKATTMNQLMCMFDTQDIRNYLNAKMTLQELIDKNWVEGKQGSEDVGRIELNALEVEPI